ncbi:MAG: repeat containing protein [Cyanobacteria bacterium RYN_339]|nr:repeat containing protein [Cyanobacteria bacterium RYN_339]
MKRPNRRILAGLALLLAACDGKLANHATPSPAKTRLVATPAPGGPPLSASPGATGPDVLQKPSRGATVLAGRIALDAGYAVGAKGATLAGDVLTVAGGQVIANNAGNVINRQQASIVSHNGANLTGKVKFVSDQGGGIISDNGAGFVSDQGAGIIANNGGGIIANHGAGFGVLEAAAQASRPAAGMLVAVLSLADDAYLPLGVDARGKAVYAVYTNAKGEFEVYLPPALARNVMLVSAAPGSQDARLAVDGLIDTGAGTGLVVDDATTVVTTYLRADAAARIAETLDPDPCRPVGRVDETLAASAQLVVQAFGEELQGAAFKALPLEARRRVLLRLSDIGIAHADLEGAQIVPSLAGRALARGTAIAALRNSLAKLEQAATARLAASPTYFDDRPYVRLAGLLHPGQPPVSIRKPADITEFLVTEFFTSNDADAAPRSEAVLVDLGLDGILREDLSAAAASLFVAAVPYLSSDEGQAATKQALRAAIADEAATPGTATSAPCVPAATPPAIAAEVHTLAGPTDMNLPAGLAYDPKGLLYVSERGSHRIRRINLADPAHPVTTIGGNGAGYVDGPGPAARFSSPVALALDAAGNLYVADQANQRIRKITGPAGASPVTSTVAGDGTAGFLDGPGAAARFSSPQGVAVGPDGVLYVSDAKNYRIRKIAADGAVTTLAGDHKDDDRVYSGFGAGATFLTPLGLALAPDGGLLVADGGYHLLRGISPAGGVSTIAGLGGKHTWRDGTFYSATFSMPKGVAAAPDGTIYVTDAAGHRIRLLQPRGFVTTIAGSGDAPGFAEGTGAAARFNGPEGIVLGPDGTLYVADTQNNRIRTLVLPKP